jgi:hypothetical protein
MKIKIDNYSFNSATKQISFTDYNTISLDGILLITNVTDNVIIYNFANPLLGGTVLGNVLTLTADTISMSNGDSLQIFYEDGIFPASQELQETLNQMLDNDDVAMRQLLQLLKPLGITTSASGRIQLDVNMIGGTLPAVTTVNTVSTVSTVSSITNQVNMGGLNALDLPYFAARNAYNTGTRANINF